MAEVSVAERLQELGAHALELDGVARHFGALVALSDISMKIAASERRAVIGSNGAGKTTLFNAITGDFMPSAGRIRFFNEDITTLSVHERIRRGLRRTYQISQLFGGLSVRDSVYLACRGVFARTLRIDAAAGRRPHHDAGRIDPSCRSSGNDFGTSWWRR